ncbi:MAG TPA: hypothetical protein VJ499_04515 [Flavisolibacter sp.]|nr:hypothetical protein [Flavisolibacter sp.]
MGLISLAELYFRSLKRIKVLSLLTKYLLQFRRLSIPHVGTFELVQHPAEFNVVDKLVLPPSFSLNWYNNDALPEHQLHYLASSFNADPESIKTRLDQFGKMLSTRVRKGSFTWKGIANLKGTGGNITIEQYPMNIDGLGPVGAHKVIRENVEHNMLVGDRQMTSQQVTDSLSKPANKRSMAVLIGWILLIITILAIVYILYRNGFNPLASGLRLKASQATIN